MWKQKLRIYKIERKERRYLQKYAKKKEPWIEQKFAQKVPKKLQSTLESAFIKAFDLIFSKGVSWIEKTYDKDAFQQTTWKRNHKYTKRIAKHHVLGAGISGVGLGLLGIGLPDIF
ncbi:EcsC family protein, partial [Faecalicoccus sp.]